MDHELWKTHGELSVGPNSTQPQQFVSHELSLQGFNTIWGKSVVLRIAGKGERETCSNLFDMGEVRSARALFVGDVSGEVHLRENERAETLIYANLFYVGEEYRSSSKHDWRVLSSDIYDRNSTRSCHYLTLLLDPQNTVDTECTTQNHAQCKVGDLVRKHGQIAIGAQNNR